MVQFSTLLTVTLSHTYYSGACRDFEFLPSADTLRQMKNVHLVSKEYDGKLCLFFEADESGSPRFPTTGTSLRFGLRLVNPFFSNFTLLNSDPGSSLQFYRNSTTAPLLLETATVIPAGPLFNHPLQKNSRPLTVACKDAGGVLLQTTAITAAEDRTSISYDLTGQTPGLYRIEETDAADTVSTDYYVDGEFYPQSLFGVVQIALDAGFYTQAAGFTINFSAKEELLKYYVVTKKYSVQELNQLSVSDAGFSEDARTQIQFTKKTDPTQWSSREQALIASSGDASAKLVLFESSSQVPRQERARKKIQLAKRGDLLITHLPQPDIQRASAEIIIQVVKP